MNSFLSKSEIKQHIHQGGGLNLALTNYPGGTLLRWNELRGIQIFVEYYQGDERPVVHLSSKRTEAAFCDELLKKVNVVKDDLIQMLELAWQYEQRRTRILSRTVTKLKPKATAVATEVKAESNAEFNSAIEDELKNSNLQNLLMQRI